MHKTGAQGDFPIRAAVLAGPLGGGGVVVGEGDQLDLPGAVYFLQEGVAGVGRAGLDDVIFGVEVVVGGQTDAAGVDDQGATGQLDDPGDMGVTAEQDGRVSGTRAGTAQPVFDLGGGRQAQAAVLDGLEQVGRVAGGGAVEEQERRARRLPGWGAGSGASSARFHSAAGRRSGRRGRALGGPGWQAGGRGCPGC